MVSRGMYVIRLGEEDKDDGSQRDHESADKEFCVAGFCALEFLQVLCGLGIGRKRQEDQQRRDKDEVVPEHPGRPFHERTLRGKHADDGHIDAAGTGERAQAHQESANEGRGERGFVHPFFKCSFGIDRDA